MNRHKEQRVGIFVDVQNMYYSAKQLYNTKVNFIQILKEGVAGRKLIRAMAYVIKADVGDEQNFFDALAKIGFDVRIKPLQIFSGGAKKGDWDVGIAMDAIRMASKLDTIILVSGDGDFQELLEYVKATGCRAEVIAFGKTTSSKLKEEADFFIDMDKSLNKYLIGHKQKRPAPRRKSPAKAAKAPTGKAKTTDTKITAKTTSTTAIKSSVPEAAKQEIKANPVIIESKAGIAENAPNLLMKKRPGIKMPAGPRPIQKKAAMPKTAIIKDIAQPHKQEIQENIEIAQKKPVQDKKKEISNKEKILRKIGLR